MDKSELKGGRAGSIHKLEDAVIRPSNAWTTDVHRFLSFMRGRGADFVPEPRGINGNGEEVLSFMPGDVFNYPLPELLLRDCMLVSSARLLQRFHQLGKSYLPLLTHNEKWMLPAVSPAEVMCHGDFAPYNVTIINEEACGIIDFDTLHPGPRLWDIAYAIYRWVPFMKSGGTEHPVSLSEQIRKAKLFLDIYGASSKERALLAEFMVNRLNALTNFMRTEAENGNRDFQLHIEQGHLAQYFQDIEYIKNHEAEITDGIMQRG